MEIRFVVAAAAAALSVVIGSAPAQAGLVGATVQSASYLNVPFPPPAASPTECTIIDCNILDYQGPSGPTNSPLPIVPVTYLEDALTETTVSVGDTQITILNNAAGLFCPSGGCTPGDFSGYVFTFTGAPDITNVTVGSGTSSDFQPVAPPTGGVTPGLTWTTNSITVNVAGDNLAVGDQLILDVTSGSFSFTRTVSGNWTDTTGWTPNGVPNGATVTAQLVNPASGTNNVNLGGGTFTVNQLQFSGTNAGTWDVTNGTIVFDGTNPTFLNQGDSSGLAGSLPNLTLNATTTFEIDNASALTDVIGDITGAGGLIKTGAGTLTLTGTNTYAGGTTISAGTLQIGNGGTTGSIVGNVLDNSALAFDRSNNVTFGGVISGTGSLTQLGAGTLTLTGANTYTGGTTISAGTLQIGNGGTTGSVAGNVADNGALAFDRSDSDTFGGVISGSGSLAQLGGGTLTLTGANTYTGGTTISAGTLQLGAGGTSGSIVGNVADNGVLAFDRSDSVTFGGVISGTGRVLQEGAGATILTSANSYSGGTTVVNGTLGVGANGALGTGSVELFTDATLAFTANGLNLANAVVLEGSLDPTIDTGANTDTISGVISGPGALTKTGSGALILTGADTYSGATTVAAGTLIVNGSIAASSSLTLESGATLGGAGTVGGFVLPSGATIAPGALIPYSTLHVAGGIGFLAGSTYVVDVNAAGRTDAVAATGKATLSGGTVDVLAAPGVYSPSTRYTILTALGGVSGTFASLTTTSNLAFLTPALSYDPDDVFLGFSVKTVTTPPTAPTQPLLFPSVAQTPNQIATATALSAQPMGSPLFNAVIGQTVPGALAAFDALSGEIHASAVSAAFDDQRLPREAVFDRLATPYGGALAGGAQSVQTLAAPNPAQVFSAWGQAFDSWGHIGGDSNAATLSNNLGGLIFGADATLQGRYRLGVAGGYDYSTLGLGARSSSGNVSTTYVGLYGGLSDGALQLRGGGFYGYNHYGTSRTAVFPGFADTLGSGYGGDTWQGFAEAGWRMPVGGLAAYSAWAEPFVGLTGLEIATRSFGESAGAAALNGASAAYNYGITTLGLRGEASLFAWTPLVANGMIGWQRAFGDVTPNSVLAFASAPDVPFAIAGAPIARNALAVEAGVDWRFTANVKLGIYYSGLIASNASDNAIKVKLEANF
jgi:fibronectin-binding autotransporter adhesin